LPLPILSIEVGIFDIKVNPVSIFKVDEEKEEMKKKMVEMEQEMKMMK
jgi:hypothetical protein